jgi:hypothetical protein
VKNNYVGSAFFDASAAAFVMPSLQGRAAATATAAATTTTESSRLCVPLGSSTTAAAASEPKPESESEYALPIHTDLLAPTDLSTTANSSGTATTRAGSAGRAAASGCGVGPEWLAKSAFRSSVSAQALYQPGGLKVERRAMYLYMRQKNSHLFVEPFYCSHIYYSLFLLPRNTDPLRARNNSAQRRPGSHLAGRGIQY